MNDTPEALEALMRTLVVNRVKPYYLYHGDLAPGKHSIDEVPLRGSVSDLCQPTYVLDILGGYGKSPIGPNYLSIVKKGIEIEDFRGRKKEVTADYSISHPYEGKIICNPTLPSQE